MAPPTIKYEGKNPIHVKIDYGDLVEPDNIVEVFDPKRLVSYDTIPNIEGEDMTNLFKLLKDRNGEILTKTDTEIRIDDDYIKKIVKEANIEYKKQQEEEKRKKDFEEGVSVGTRLATDESPPVLPIIEDPITEQLDTKPKYAKAPSVATASRYAPSVAESTVSIRDLLRSEPSYETRKQIADELSSLDPTQRDILISGLQKQITETEAPISSAVSELKRLLDIKKEVELTNIEKDERYISGIRDKPKVVKTKLVIGHKPRDDLFLIKRKPLILQTIKPFPN